MQAATEFRLTDQKKVLTVSLLALFFMASAVLQYKIRFSEIGEMPSGGLKENTQAPAFSAPDLSGQRVSLEDFRGKTVVLDFWATWCGPCRTEFADLRAWWEKNQSRFPALAIVAVNLRENRSEVQSYVEQMKLPFTVLLDADGKVSEQYQVKALPTLYIINPEGVVVDTNIGYSGGLSTKLQVMLESIHGGKKP
jgi:peroxiredoxin